MIARIWLRYDLTAKLLRGARTQLGGRGLGEISNKNSASTRLQRRHVQGFGSGFRIDPKDETNADARSVHCLFIIRARPGGEAHMVRIATIVYQVYEVWKTI